MRVIVLHTTVSLVYYKCYFLTLLLAVNLILILFVIRYQCCNTR